MTTRRSPQVPLQGGNVDLKTGVVDLTGRPSQLTDRERALLAHLVRTPNYPASREDLHRGVWGDAPGPSRAIDVAVARLRQKIEEDPSRPQHLITVRGRGYLFRPVGGKDSKPTISPVSGKFIGRTTELARAVHKLQDPRVPCLVVWGMVGVGKTRLAKEIVGATSSSWKAVRWVDGKGSNGQSRVAALLGCDNHQIATHLHQAQGELWVLDDWTGAIPTEWIGVGPTLLVTSPVRLDVSSAISMLLQPLSQQDARRLLAARTRERWECDPKDHPELDPLPLLIEALADQHPALLANVKQARSVLVPRLKETTAKLSTQTKQGLVHLCVTAGPVPVGDAMALVHQDQRTLQELIDHNLVSITDDVLDVPGMLRDWVLSQSEPGVVRSARDNHLSVYGTWASAQSPSHTRFFTEVSQRTGEIVAAISYATDSGRAAKAMDLIRLQARSSQHSGGDLETLALVKKMLAATLSQGSTQELALLHANTLLRMGDINAAEQVLPDTSCPGVAGVKAAIAGMRGDAETALHHIQAGLAQTGSTPDERSRLHRMRGMALTLLADDQGAEAALMQSLSWARSVGQHDEIVTALLPLAVLLRRRWRPTEALVYLDEAVETAETMAHPRLTAMSRSARAKALSDLARYRQAEPAYLQAIAEAGTMEGPVALGLLRVAYATLTLETGREALALRILDLVQRSALQSAIVDINLNLSLGLIRWKMGACVEARGHFGQAVALSHTLGDKHQHIEALVVRGLVLDEPGDLALAKTLGEACRWPGLLWLQSGIEGPQGLPRPVLRISAALGKSSRWSGSLVGHPL